MSAIEWPDSGMSPFRLIPWRQACADLDCSSDTLIRLLAAHEVDVVHLTKRKRSVLPPLWFPDYSTARPSLSKLSATPTQPIHFAAPDAARYIRAVT
jgi:hypothetical protein